MSPSKKPPEIRRLKAADARNYRAVLVEALIVHPDCFAEDYNAEISRPLSETGDELERTATFGVWLGDVLVGIGSAVPCNTQKRQHCGILRNLYVREKFRHRGFAGLLLRAILTHVTRELEQLETQVPLRCERAVRLFEKFGFRMCGLIPNGLKVGQGEVDVWLMTQSLR
jgi:GNAT superfamily N-acetyltransferase